MPSRDIFALTNAAAQIPSIAYENIFYAAKGRDPTNPPSASTDYINRRSCLQKTAAQHGQEASEQVRLDVPVLRSVPLTNPIIADATRMDVAM